jgi:hypothetical protein
MHLAKETTVAERRLCPVIGAGLQRTQLHCPAVCAGLLLGGTSEKVLTVLPSTDRVSNAIERARSTSRPLRSGPVLPFPNGHA